VSVLASPNSLRVCNWISEARSSWDQPTVAECAVRQPQSPERLRRHSTELLVSRATLLLLTVEPRLPPPCSQKATRTGRTCTPSALASVHDHGLAIGERATLDPRRSNSSWIPSSSRSPLRSTAKDPSEWVTLWILVTHLTPALALSKRMRRIPPCMPMHNLLMRQAMVPPESREHWRLCACGRA